MKKKLSRQEEFEILKLVLDKFLWLGFGIMAFGLFQILSGTGLLARSFLTIFSGMVILLLFVYLIVKEYEIIK